MRAPDQSAPGSNTPDPRAPGSNTPDPRAPGSKAPDPRAPGSKAQIPSGPDPNTPDPRAPGSKAPAPRAPGSKAPAPRGDADPRAFEPGTADPNTDARRSPHASGDATPRTAKDIATSVRRGNTPSKRGALVLALIAALVAAAVVLPALGSHGLWAGDEMEVFNRSRASLGVALSDLVRAPWLPDALRTAAYKAIGAPEAIRLPGALATIGLVGLTTLVAAARGIGPLAALIAGAFALAFPLTLAQGRLALGAPVAELFAATAAIAGYLSLRLRGWRALAAACASAACIAIATASTGLVMGALLPLLAIAVGRPTSPRPPVRRAVLGLWLLIIATTLLAAWLIYGQADGYIPLLGAAKDLTLRERPEVRGFTASLQDLGLQIFPWLPLALIGVLRPGRMRWPALWLLCGLGLHSVISLVYGPGPLPLTVPAALCCTAGLVHLADPTTHRQLRRLALLLAIGGIFVIGKDAKRTPAKFAAVLAPPQNEDHLPAAEIGADLLLPRLSTLGVLMLLIAGVAGGRRLAKPWLAPGTAAIVLLYQSTMIGHSLIPRISALRSLKAPLARLATWTRNEELPPTLAISRVQGSDLAVYGPPEPYLHRATTRSQQQAWLRRPEPSVALIRKADLPSLFAAHRRDNWPLYVLDHSHNYWTLLSNTLPAAAVDQNPLSAVVLDEAKPLAHETLVRFDNYLEIVGWQLEEPVIRGTETTVILMIKVLRQLPAGAQMNLRLQGGKLSRIGGTPEPFADGLYPTNLWRPGDFIVHRHPLKVPLLEVVSGTHKLIIGVRRSRRKNLAISEPSGEHGAYGVEVKGKKREFATIGEVSVW